LRGDVRMELAKVTSLEAIREAQTAFSGEAERAGLGDESDVVALVGEIRRERARRDVRTKADPLNDMRSSRRREGG